jgi:hypothetical protein
MGPGAKVYPRARPVMRASLRALTPPPKKDRIDARPKKRRCTDILYGRTSCAEKDTA